MATITAISWLPPAFHNFTLAILNRAVPFLTVWLFLRYWNTVKLFRACLMAICKENNLITLLNIQTKTTS